MNDRQLIGTAFEYAEIKNKSSVAADIMETLLPLLKMYKLPTDEIDVLYRAHVLLKKYSYKFGIDGFNKDIKHLDK